VKTKDARLSQADGERWDAAQKRLDDMLKRVAAFAVRRPRRPCRTGARWVSAGMDAVPPVASP
jgi:hypothetical protein